MLAQSLPGPPECKADTMKKIAFGVGSSAAQASISNCSGQQDWHDTAHMAVEQAHATVDFEFKQRQASASACPQHMALNML